jgi:metal-dependent amidase/aminoacylase/carboxypeptidase family protein
MTSADKLGITVTGRGAWGESHSAVDPVVAAAR